LEQSWLIDRDKAGVAGAAFSLDKRERLVKTDDLGWFEADCSVRIHYKGTNSSRCLVGPGPVSLLESLERRGGARGVEEAQFAACQKRVAMWRDPYDRAESIYRFFRPNRSFRRARRKGCEFSTG